MQSPEERIGYLMFLDFQGTVSPEEKLELDAYLDAKPGRRERFDKRQDPAYINSSLKALAHGEAVKKMIWNKINQSKRTID